METSIGDCIRLAPTIYRRAILLGLIQHLFLDSHFRNLFAPIHGMAVHQQVVLAIICIEVKLICLMMLTPILRVRATLLRIVRQKQYIHSQAN